MAVKDLPIVSIHGKFVGRITLEDDYEDLLKNDTDLVLSPARLTFSDKLIAVVVLPREAAKT